MKKIIAMIVLFTIMTGCGKTARLESLEREREAQIAAEQARIEAARLANRSFLKKSWDHIWTHKLGYGLGALVAAGTYYLVSHFPKPKQQEAIPQGNNNPEGNIHQPNLGADLHQNIAELNQHVAEHFAENNIQQLPAAEQNQIIQNPLENVEIQHLPVQQIEENNHPADANLQPQDHHILEGHLENWNQPIIQVGEFLQLLNHGQPELDAAHPNNIEGQVAEGVFPDAEVINAEIAEFFANPNMQPHPVVNNEGAPHQQEGNIAEPLHINDNAAQVQVDVHPNPQPQVQQGMQAIEEHPNDGFVVFNPGVENEEPQLKIEEDIIDIDANPAEVIVNANPLPLQEVYRIGADVNEHVDFESPAEPVQAEDPDRVAEEAQASNQTQTLNQINNPISPHSLIGMPNFNKPKTMLALEYHPKTPIDIVIPEQVANFLNQQPVNHPWQPNSNVFNEPFIQHYEKTFKQKPILLLTYDPNRMLQPEPQIEGFQKINESQQINIPQMLADYAAMKANHTEPIIVEVSQPAGIPEVPKIAENAQTQIQTIVIPKQVANFVNQAPINNPSIYTFNNPISQHSLIRMPDFNNPKPLLALTYQPTPAPVETVVIPEQVANFLNQQPVNHPWLPNSGVFNEPFIQHYEKTFKQKPILLLTYDPNRMLQPEPQIESFQKINVNQQINIPQMLAKCAEMEAKHTEPIIVEANQPVQNPIGKQVAEHVNFKSPAIPVQSIAKVPRVLGNAQAPIETIVIPKQVATFIRKQPINNPSAYVFNRHFSPLIPVRYGNVSQPNSYHIDVPLAIDYDRHETLMVIPEPAANFARLLQILNPLNEPFIPQVPVDFSQTYQPEGYLTLTSQELQKPVQKVNENPLASVEETVENNFQTPIPDTQQLTINHQDEPIKAVETPVRKARDPLLDEALFAIYGDERRPGSRYGMAVDIATNLYAWGWENAYLPENERVPWIRYTQAIWEAAIERWDQERFRGIKYPPRPVYPWLPIEEKTRQEKAAEERLAVNDAVYKYAWGWHNVNAPTRVNWALYTRDIWEKAIAKWDLMRFYGIKYPPRPVPPW